MRPTAMVFVAGCFLLSACSDDSGATDIPVRPRDLSQVDGEALDGGSDGPTTADLGGGDAAATDQIVSDGPALDQMPPDLIGQIDSGPLVKNGIPGLNDMVHDITTSGSDVYVAGKFTSAGGIANANHVARWDGASWHALGNGLSGLVTSLVWIGSDLYAGGCDVHSNHPVARWDGAQWTPVSSSKQLGTCADAMTVEGSKLYAGGTSDIAWWDGTSWHSVGAWSPMMLRSITVAPSGVYVGGGFFTGPKYIAHWNGTIWHTLGNGLNAMVYATAALGNDVYAAGLFSNHNYLARWDGTAWHNTPGQKGPPQGMKAVGGDIYVVGGSNLVQPHQYVARLVAGKVWTSPKQIVFFLTNPPVPGKIPYARAIGVSGSTVYLGGNFPAVP